MSDEKEKDETKQCKCGNPAKPHYDNGLYCGDDMCDGCFTAMQIDCRKCSW